MASSENLSLEQALETRKTDYSLECVIKRSVNKFYPLRRLLDDYSTFSVEASFCLENVFKRNEARRSNMDKVILGSVLVYGFTRD